MLRRLLMSSLLLVGVLLPLAAPITVSAESSTSSISVQKVEGERLGKKFETRARSSWPWYVTRASGIVAAVSLIILMLSGIGQITGYTFRLLDPITSWATHRALGIAFGVSVLIHVFSLLFDHFIQFNIFQLFVPWLSDYKPVTFLGLHFGSLYVAFGVIAFYLVITIILTSLIWVERKPHTWKILHLLSYIAVALIFVHALFIGTDVAHGWLKIAWIVLNVAVLAAAITRLRRAYTI